MQQFSFWQLNIFHAGKNLFIILDWMASGITLDD